MSAWTDGTPATWGEQYEGAREAMRMAKHAIFAKVLGVDLGLERGEEPLDVVGRCQEVAELCDDLLALAESIAWAVRTRTVG